MDKIIPEKLKQGDEVRIIAPSRNMNILGDDCIELAKKNLESLGLKVTFGENISHEENALYGCASIKDRVSDLEKAFKDKNVKAILTVIGGFNTNQILEEIDYEIIKNNPKIICGYSDITALLHAITVKTGLVTYYGPHFSSLGMKNGLEYTMEYFKKIFFESNSISIEPSIEWSNDLWFLDQEKRNFIKNEGMQIINKGEGEGKIIGGNLCTLNLLQGTPYFKEEKENIILFIEDDGIADKNFILEFDRNLVSLIQCIRPENIKGIIVGRAEQNCEMTLEKWQAIFESKKELKNIPIIINADFGHTTPQFTFPIGGYAKITVKEKIEIEIKD